MTGQTVFTTFTSGRLDGELVSRLVHGAKFNALAATLMNLFIAENILRLRAWKSADAVVWETSKWVDWFNSRYPFGTLCQLRQKALHANKNTVGKVA